MNAINITFSFFFSFVLSFIFILVYFILFIYCFIYLLIYLFCSLNTHVLLYFYSLLTDNALTRNKSILMMLLIFIFEQKIKQVTI